MNLMDLFIKITCDSSEVENGVKTAQGKLQGFKGTSAAVFGAFEQIGIKAANAVFSAISSSVDGAVARVDTLNNFTKVMTNLGYSMESADASREKLASSLDHLPTTLDKVISQVQGMAPLTETLDEATDVTYAWVNAMAAGGQSVEQQSTAVDAWTRAMSKGKVEMNEWEQLIRTAPGQMDQLSKAILGADASYGDLKTALDSGEVSMEQVNDTMVAMTGSLEEGGDVVEINGQKFASWAKQAQDASAGIQISVFNVKAALQRNLAGVIDGINKRFEDFGGISGIISSVIPAIDSIGERFKALASGDMSIGEFLSFDPSGIIAKIDEGLPTLIEKGLEWAEGFSGSLREGFSNLVSNGIEIAQHIAQGIAEAMPVMVEKIPTIVSNIAGLINDNAPKILKAGINIIVTLAKGLIQAIPTIVANLPKIVQAIWDVFTAVNWVALGGTIIKGIANGIKSLVSSIPGVLKSIGSKAATAFKSVNWAAVGKAAISFIKTAVSGGASAIPSILKAIGSKAANAFKSINWGAVGKAVVNGIVAGVKAAGSALFNALKSLAKSALNAAKNALGIKSPSKVFRDQVGKQIGYGMALGIEDSIPAVTDAMNMMDASAVESASKPILLDVATTGIGSSYDLSAQISDLASGGATINNYITVDGADNPEDFANRLVRQMKLDMRMT